MEERIDEGIIKGSKEIELLDKTELKKMSKYICKISGNNIGTGFFCRIKYGNDLIGVLITNYHIIDDYYLENNKELKLYINNESKIININKNSKIYSSKRNKYDIMIIKSDEEEIKDYLDIDENIFNYNSDSYKNEHIYILHYPNSDEASISFGCGLEKIDKYNIKHLCNTEPGSSGGPILSLLTNKIIGIHKWSIIKNSDYKYNIGTFLKFPLNELNNKSEIQIQIRIKEKDINKKIYFLNNTDYEEEGIKHIHNNLQELNDSNIELYINNKKKYKKYFKPKNEGIYTALLRFNISLKDFSYMFYNCKNIINIEISNFDSKIVINMSKMFAYCESLESLNGISFLNTSNVTNMSSMFSNCITLISLPDISNWDLSNVNDMNHMFYACESLQSLPDISKWNTSNVNNMSYMFSLCKSLISLPNISKWDTKNVTDMSYIFHSCLSLDYLPNIYKWDITNVKNKDLIFGNFKSFPLLSIKKKKIKMKFVLSNKIIKISKQDKKEQIIRKIILLYFNYKKLRKTTLLENNKFNEYYLVNKALMKKYKDYYNFSKISEEIDKNSLIQTSFDNIIKDNKNSNFYSEEELINLIIKQIPKNILDDLYNKDNNFCSLLNEEKPIRNITTIKYNENDILFYFSNFELISAEIYELLFKYIHMNALFQEGKNVIFNNEALKVKAEKAECIFDNEYIIIKFPNPNSNKKYLIEIGKLNNNNIFEPEYFLLYEKYNNLNEHVQKIIQSGGFKEYLKTFSTKSMNTFDIIDNNNIKIGVAIKKNMNPEYDKNSILNIWNQQNSTNIQVNKIKNANTIHNNYYNIQI